MRRLLYYLMKEGFYNMKEVSSTLTYRGEEIKIIFNLNVMEAIQKEYGTIAKWGELTDGKAGEVDIKALIFGITEMMNEAIDIENDENGTNKPFLTHKKVARIITEIGVDNTTNRMNGVVIESTKSEEKNG